MNNATLEEVLKKIKKKTKYDMMYQMKDVKEIENVVIHSQTSYIFLTGPQCAEPEARCYGGASRSLQAYYTPVLK